jgi:hypothetical protein
VWTPTFNRYAGHRKELCLGAMPKELSRLVSIRAKDWERYQDDLERIPAWEQAERFARLKEAHRLKSNCALERMLGLPHGRVSRALRALELPAPVLAYLKAHATPAMAREFHERALSELARLEDPIAICRQFRKQIAKFEGNRLKDGCRDYHP